MKERTNHEIQQSGSTTIAPLSSGPTPTTYKKMEEIKNSSSHNKKSNNNNKKRCERSEREKILDNYFSANNDSNRSNISTTMTPIDTNESIATGAVIDYEKNAKKTTITISNDSCNSNSNKKANHLSVDVEIVEQKEEFQNGPYTFLPYYTLATTTATETTSTNNKGVNINKNNNTSSSLSKKPIQRYKSTKDRKVDRFGFIIDSDVEEEDEDEEDSIASYGDEVGTVATSTKTQQCNNTTKSKRSLKGNSSSKNNRIPHSREVLNSNDNINQSSSLKSSNTSYNNNNNNSQISVKHKSTSQLSKLRKLRMKKYTSQKYVSSKNANKHNNGRFNSSSSSALAQHKKNETKTHSLRYQKWTVMLSSWDRTTTLYKTKLIRRLRKGIPDAIRGPAWSLIGNVPFSIESQPGKYHELLYQANAFYDNGAMSIERDIHRTFPRHSFFAGEAESSRKKHNHNSASVAVHNSNNPYDTVVAASSSDTDHDAVPDLMCENGGQASLRRVLRAYSILDHEVFYCQGMNFIAAMFLTFMTEEEAFWLFVNIMNHPPCKMRHLFGENMSYAQQVLHVASRLIQHYLPKLHAHFERENIHITMYATQWLLTIYTSSFKFELVTRVWDVFLFQGWKVVYRVMLSILDLGSKEMLNMTFEQILGYMKKLPHLFSEDVVMKRAFSIKLRTKSILKYEKEWMEMQN